MRVWIFAVALLGLLSACRSASTPSAADSSQATSVEPVLVTVAAGGIT